MEKGFIFMNNSYISELYRRKRRRENKNLLGNGKQ
jgi:hypothetical protein